MYIHEPLYIIRVWLEYQQWQHREHFAEVAVFPILDLFETSLNIK
jgi:hypothetical protein